MYYRKNNKDHLVSVGCSRTVLRFPRLSRVKGNGELLLRKVPYLRRFYSMILYFSLMG